jgi:hypothetical protein
MTALPSVIPLMPIPPGFDLSRTRPTKFQRSWIAAQDDADLQIVCNEQPFRVHALGDIKAQAVCAVIPLDVLFDLRMKAARRMWLSANGRNPAIDSTALSKTQRDHLAKALRALDGRLEGAPYRDIATVLFGAHRVPERGWKTHDLRDRTIRLCKFGFDLMEGGYRRLLLHPLRQRLY